MDFLTPLLVILGLALFETVSSVDNAIINAEVVSTMQPKARNWFLWWGLLIAVFLVRGLLPWAIVWTVNPSLGPIQAFTAALSSDPAVVKSVDESAPLLLIGGGTFLLLLFFHWLFMEPKAFGIRGERFFVKHGVWFYAVASLVLSVIVWMAIHTDPYLAFSAVLGSTAFFITHGFKESAARLEANLATQHRSDISKIMYLEILDATFSIDGVLGAFAFTLSIPLILLGNGLGAMIVRQLTVGNIKRIRKYVYLKNGAMYSILFLGLIMLTDSFGFKIPSYVSPLTTFIVIGYFFWKSKMIREQV
jgi:hypothetical protein